MDKNANRLKFWTKKKCVTIVGGPRPVLVAWLGEHEGEGPKKQFFRKKKKFNHSKWIKMLKHNFFRPRKNKFYDHSEVPPGVFWPK